MNYHDELRRRLRQRPLEPFRIHLTDGRTFDVRYPDLNLVFTTYALIGIPEVNEPDPFAERLEEVELALIRRIEPLPASAAPAVP